MRHLAAILPIITLLAACSSKPTPPPDGPRNPFSGGNSAASTPSSAPGGFLLQPEHSGQLQNGDFAYDAGMNAFVDKMVREHGFDRQQLHDVLAQTKRLGFVLRLMDQQAPTGGPPSGPNGAWLRYRAKFITPDNVQNGVVFWNQYRDALQRAEQIYGVPPEIIVGIIGVETRWGRVMGKTRIIDALATLSFAYPRRAEYFQSELETFLLMCRQEQDDPLSLRGSFAGAMGYGQFMPSAFKNYAVDFDGDGHVNLWDPIDAIGSVANYFKGHGWTRGAPVAVPAAGQAPLLGNGFNTKYPLFTLKAAGLSPLGSLANYQEASLLRLDMGQNYQYWYGLPNFYTITRYNHSTQYAMAVWQLGEAVSRARSGN
ncbi:lytic murein transglycosylase B [Ewingella americana]|uniref:lytic murein transglycosylase B n=1 Tax=Ewingella americana TaxID=41202 RepID=UPI00163B4A80|nr:lytic murein transglycosylase B [Ewingella americana]QMV52806.1 lytic murein transglycosylase B [Ewingella americana]